MKITFIGGGNMASALISGLLKQGYSAGQIGVVEINEDTRARLKTMFGITAVADLKGGLSSATRSGGTHVVVLAVKPQQLQELSQQMRESLDRQLVISIAAGIRATDLMRWLGGYQRIIRAMPNTPSLVGAGVTGLYAVPDVIEQDRHIAESIMEAVGSILWVGDEDMLHTITAICGSGPAYVFYFIESMQTAGIKLGLSENEARTLALQTFQGAVKLANEGDEDVAVLRSKVTSKGGTTQQAIETLDAGDVKNRIIAAVFAANVRSREMSEEFGKL
ncbi:pyrroline-5-carboxylate reductase [Nitrosomonas sp. Nm51]|uniref:pyrroline-5-carboxylate reductase n=1 Tax=Nitrosomonas sp. Nm51 TaxID=133720 RepID=UPI0008B6A7F0|nr:pyrroline-5-carboxylate reductase [Nitrosomonas sp. Nm51]SER35845.1 pyrroline-5-carboxylate reductase [Nitrosomonas sp. Nm51]